MKEETQQLLAQGLLAGVLGHVTAAVVFAVANAMAGRPLLYTPAVLGASLFYGLTDPSQLEIRAAYVFAYNGTHLLVFIAFGLVAAWLATVADRGQQLWYVAVFFLLFVAFHVIGAFQLVAAPMRDTVPEASLWIAGFGATAVMAAYQYAYTTASRPTAALGRAVAVARTRPRVAYVRSTSRS